MLRFCMWVLAELSDSAQVPDFDSQLPEIDVASIEASQTWGPERGGCALLQPGPVWPSPGGFRWLRLGAISFDLQS